MRMENRSLNGLFPSGAVRRPESIAGQVYRRLRQAIISRRLPTGERLREVEIARAMGVSRTPVREAIVRLVSDRLVRPLPGGGVEVVNTSRELEEIYHVRKALEGYATRLAAERITDDELRTLTELLEDSARTDHEAFDRRVGLNEQFHSVISVASRVPRLIEMIRELREYSTNPQTLRLYGRPASRIAFQQHREILRWLQARDFERAEAAMRQHLDDTYRQTVSAREREADEPTDPGGGTP